MMVEKILSVKVAYYIDIHGWNAQRRLESGDNIKVGVEPSDSYIS